MSEIPEAAIEIRDLRVDYGDFIAVNDVSLSIPRGVVFGLVGPNGAGKTSTFNVLATLMEPTYGEVTLAGHDVLEATSAARRIMGYMPDMAPVPSDLKVWEFLDFYAEAHALGARAARRERVAECLEAVHLSEKRDAWCRALSRGQTQRLVLAKTLLHRPRVLILDEPASGLDPLSRRELRMTLQGLAAEGVTVLVSSHILSELAEMCSLLCVMNQGRILSTGTADQVRRELGRSDRLLCVTVADGQDALLAWLSRSGEVHDVEQDGAEVRFGFKGDNDGQAGLLAEMVGAGLRIKSFEERGSSFEQILVEVAEGNRVQ